MLVQLKQRVSYNQRSDEQAGGHIRHIDTL